MTCVKYGDGSVVCTSDPEYLRRVRFCPVEQRRRRMVAQVADWYSATWTCCGCGDEWTDGEMHQRPFRPGWRRDNAAEAKRMWADHDPMSPVIQTRPHGV